MRRARVGACILRIDDTDTERAAPEFNEAIQQDLDWLGLDWDRTVRQSARLGEYTNAHARLVESGHIYPSFETPQGLAVQRDAQRAAGAPTLYDRAALVLSYAQKADLEAQGRAPYWRLRLSADPIT